MQCFDTFRGFLHKIYAATMDGKGREGTYNFFSRRLGAAGGQGIGHTRTFTRFGDRAFPVAGPRLCNSLPSDLQQSDLALHQFRWGLKTYFFC